MDYFEQKTPENEQTQEELFPSPLLSKNKSIQFPFCKGNLNLYRKFFICKNVFLPGRKPVETILITRDAHLHKIQPLFITYCWSVAAKNFWGDSDPQSCQIFLSSR